VSFGAHYVSSEQKRVVWFVTRGRSVSSFWTAMLGPDNAVSELPYSLSSDSRSISLNESAPAGFDTPNPTSSLPGLEL